MGLFIIKLHLVANLLMGIPLEDYQNENEESEKRTLTLEATAYTAYCDGCIGITYTGYDVHNTVYYEDMRVVAVDPDVIPLYSIMEVSYDDVTFTAIALDTGSAIQGYDLDLLVKSKDKAFEFGRRDVTVTIIREGKGT